MAWPFRLMEELLAINRGGLKVAEAQMYTDRLAAAFVGVAGVFPSHSILLYFPGNFVILRTISGKTEYVGGSVWIGC
jgi:hypothetical protein